MRRTPRSLLAGATLLAAVCTFALGGCAGAGGDPSATASSTAGATTGSVPLDQVPEIASIRWQQAASLPDFDHSPGTTSEPADIADLRQVLAEHGVIGAWRFRHADCEGGLTTWVTYTTVGGDEVELQANSCEGANAFETDLNDLVSRWRER